MALEETSKLFDDWARRGRADGMARSHAARAVSALQDIPLDLGDKALDVGCGTGWATRWLRKAVGRFGFAAGVDAAPEMIALAKSEAADMYSVNFRVCAFEALPWKDGFFHHAFSMEALYYAADLDLALTEVARVVREGGTLTVCTDFYEENTASHGWPEMMGIPMTMLSEAGWAQALDRAGFTLERSFRCFDPRPVSADLPEAERAAELHFRTAVGTLAVRGVRRG